MSAFADNPWVKADKKKNNGIANNPWVQKDKEKAEEKPVLPKPVKAPRKVVDTPFPKAEEKKEEVKPKVISFQ